MTISILFDKTALRQELRSGWGVSFLIDGKILFDTGEKGEWLIENMAAMGVDIDKIEAIVISHDHWDHWGGLWSLLEKKKNTKLYICPRFGSEFKQRARSLGAEIVEAERSKAIGPGIFTTGEIPGVYHGKYMAEQSLVLKTSRGLTVITGCAHPGIIKIMETVKERFPAEAVYLVFGGFHLKESDRRAIEIAVENFKKLNVKKVGPTHCSGEASEEIFKKYYGDNFIPIKTGGQIEV